MSLMSMFSENSRVKIPAIVHLTRLGYGYLSLRDPNINSQIDRGTNIFRDILTTCDKEQSMPSRTTTESHFLAALPS